MGDPVIPEVADREDVREAEGVTESVGLGVSETEEDVKPMISMGETEDSKIVEVGV